MFLQRAMYFVRLRVFVPFLCHLDHFGDNIFKVFVHIRNQNT